MRIEAGELRDAARGLLGGRSPAAGPQSLWPAIVEAGWPALMTPEALGGLEQTMAEAVVLYAELGRALSPAPLAPALMTVETLCACAPSAGRDDWLERIAGGEPVAASLVDPAAAALTLGADGALSGVICAVVGADGASHALVSTGEVVALIPLAASGVELSARPTWDTSRSLADLRFAEVKLDDAWVFARGPAARSAMEAGSAHLHFALAADCVGAADVILADTVAYLTTRRQFDRPLAMFQALKHRCADLKVAVQAAEALLTDSVRSGGGAAALVRAKAAKALASSTFRAVTEEALQLHGGMGMTAEHPCHLFLKRALLNEQLGAADDTCDLAVAADLVESLRV